MTSSPKKRTLPLRGGKSPVMTLKSVVLPAPLAPSTARRSPGRRRQADVVEGDERTEVAAHALDLEGASRCALRNALCSVGHPFSGSIAFRVVAANRADRHELGAVHVERLVDARDDLDDLVVEAAVRRARPLR